MPQSVFKENNAPIAKTPSIKNTYTLVGAVLGVGMARGIAAINLRAVGSIFLFWIITLPAGASLFILFFLIFRGIFS